MRTGIALGLITILTTAYLFRKELMCAWIGSHDLRRYWHYGGFQCSRCGGAFRDMDEAGAFGRE
jgi:hypothetical protein